MPDKNFDYFVIGTGPAGQSVATAAAKAGHSVGVTDHRPYGGVCPLRGCDPKKVLLAAAKAMNAVDRLKGKGFDARPPFNWADLQHWKREFTKDVSSGTQKKFDKLGIEQYHERAKFLAPHRLQLGNKTIRADRIIIATGATPAPLDFPGADLLQTSEAFLDLLELPPTLIIVGGGYIGAEFAHIATLLGSQVTVIAAEERPIAKFDDDLSDLLAKAAAKRGMELHFSTEATGVEAEKDGVRVFARKEDGSSFSVTAAAAFHCAGRVPNIQALELDCAGIEYGDKGITVSDQLCTSVRAHYAIGDCADSGLDLTPVASREARILKDNLFHGKQSRIDYFPVPTLAFTIPPIASVGMTAHEAEKSEKNLRIVYEETTNWFHTQHTNGLVSAHKIIIDDDQDRILGAHLLGPDTEETINLLTLAIKQGISITDLKKMVWAYPTAGGNISSMLG